MKFIKFLQFALLLLLAIPATAQALSTSEQILKNGLDMLDQAKTTHALAYYKKLKPYPQEQQIMAWAIALYGEDIEYSSLEVLKKYLANWPQQIRIQHNIERAVVKTKNEKIILDNFGNSSPKNFHAAFNLALYYKNKNQTKKAYEIIAPIWRSENIESNLERQIKNTFGKLLTKHDYIARVELLLAKKLWSRAKLLAAKANMAVLVNARVAVEKNHKNAGTLLRPLYDVKYGTTEAHANFLLSLARFFRRNGETEKAAQTLISSPPPHKNAGDIFQQEQRIIASELLEIKKYKQAYELVKRNFAKTNVQIIDGEFYAGWIALRFLQQPQLAEQHFVKILSFAKMPLSISRGNYWLARAYEAQNKKQLATENYKQAAFYDATFYGQLALVKLGIRQIKFANYQISQNEKQMFENNILVQAIKKLEKVQHPNKAKLFYQHLAKTLKNRAHINLLVERRKKTGSHAKALDLAKMAHKNGVQVKSLAWPVGAIPIARNKNNASFAYAIARQESTFQTNARSSANALGLMQLLPTTARASARQAGVRYSKALLTTDPAYNARLGTVYLTNQIKKFNGSYILAFAAYNAGPNRINQWLERFGTPQNKPVEQAIDWIENIPFAETRNYVQRVMENFQIYKAQLANSQLSIDKDLRR